MTWQTVHKISLINWPNNWIWIRNSW